MIGQEQINQNNKLLMKRRRFYDFYAFLYYIIINTINKEI